MNEALVKLKSNSTNRTIFSLNGGSEYADFIKVAFISDQDENCSVQAEDSIVSINNVNVIGYSLTDANTLLDAARYQSETCHIKYFTKNKYNKDLRSFLYSTHLPGSSDDEAKIGGFINLFSYEKILCTDEALCNEKEEIYQHAPIETICELQENDCLLYVCQDDNILFALQTPDIDSTMDTDFNNFIRSNRHQGDEISSLSKCNTQDPQLTHQHDNLHDGQNCLSTIDPDDPLPAGRHQRMLITIHKVNVLPIKQHFGFELIDMSYNNMTRSFVDPESEFKGFVEIAKIHDNWPNKVIYRLRKKDVIYSVDDLNAKENTSEEMMLYALKQMEKGKITKFVFLRVQFYTIKDVCSRKPPAFSLAVVSIYKHSEDEDSLDDMDFECGNPPLPMPTSEPKSIIIQPINLKDSQQNRDKQSLSKFGRIYQVESVKVKPHLCQIFFKPGDIIWSVNSVELANKDPEFVEKHIKSCKEQNESVNMVIWSETKPLQDLNTIAKINSNCQYTQKNKPKQISQVLNIPSQLKNQLDLSEIKLPVKTTLCKKAIDQYGLVISQNTQKQFVVDSLVVDSVAQSSKKLNPGDVIVSVNKVPTRDLSIKALQHLIVSSQKYLELELFKRDSGAEQGPLTISD